MDAEMAALLTQLLHKKNVSVIGGGSFAQFEGQFVKSLNSPAELLSVYQENLTPEEKTRIRDAFNRALPEVGYVPPERPYGEIIEDRGTQITFSAFGQQAHVSLKQPWDLDHTKHMTVIRALEKYIPEFEIKSGGMTSIDVTRKGIDKAYGKQESSAYRSLGQKRPRT